MNACILPTPRSGLPPLPESGGEKWVTILEDFRKYHRKNASKLKERIRHGIPDAARPLAWAEILRVGTLRDQNSWVYSKLLETVSFPCEQDIRKDLHRTFPDHPYFSERDGPGQRALFNVLKAYSIYDPSVGYCQGMSFMVGLLLMYFTEEGAFWGLVRLLKEPKYALSGLHKPGAEVLGQCLFQLEMLLDHYLPDVAKHFARPPARPPAALTAAQKAKGISPYMYASEWFITVFSRSFPLPLLVRIWDCFVFEGYKILFRVSVALLKLQAEELLRMDFEALMEALRSLPRAAGQPDAVMKAGFDLWNLSLRHLEKYAGQYEGEEGQKHDDEQDAKITSAAGRATGRAGAWRLGYVHVTILEARGLAARDVLSQGRSSNPYCIVRSGPEVRRTETVEGSVAPRWQHNEFHMPLDTGDPGARVVVEVYSKEKLFGVDPYLGEVVLSFASLRLADGPTEAWFPLETARPNQKVSGDLRLHVQLYTDEHAPPRLPSASSGPRPAAPGPAPAPAPGPEAGGVFIPSSWRDGSRPAPTLPARHEPAGQPLPAVAAASGAGGGVFIPSGWASRSGGPAPAPAPAGPAAGPAGRAAPAYEGRAPEPSAVVSDASSLYIPRSFHVEPRELPAAAHAEPHEEQLVVGLTGAAPARTSSGLGRSRSGRSSRGGGPDSPASPAAGRRSSTGSDSSGPASPAPASPASPPPLAGRFARLSMSDAGPPRQHDPHLDSRF